MKVEFIFSYIESNLWQLVGSFLLGIFIGIILCSKLNQRLDNIVIVVSFLVAAICLIVSITSNKQEISIAVLSFYSSFVFSWLLTKQSSKGEFKEQQQEIAKTSWRHIGDVKKATLVTRNRLDELKKKGTMITSSDIEGILGNIEIIMQCIESNEEDWEDMMSDDYLRKMRNKNDLKGKDKVKITPPDNRQIKDLITSIFKKDNKQTEKQNDDEKTSDIIEEDQD